MKQNTPNYSYDNMTAQKTAVVIGAGIGGIASAIRMARKGYKVQVFEANSYPGGKLSEFTDKGYRFDAGPSLFTLPHLVDELFTTSGKNPRDYFNYQRLETVCNYFYENGTFFKAYAAPDRYIEEAAKVFAEPAANIQKHLESSREIYQLTHELFMYNSLHKVENYLNKATLKALFNIGKLQLNKTMHTHNSSAFRNPLLTQLYNRYATYNGSDPYKAPATLHIIPHLEQHLGAYIPEGGMYSITKSLYTLAQEMGVIFNFNCKVQQIQLSTDRKKVTGITVNDTNVQADTVISNMDVYYTYHQLLKEYQLNHSSLEQPRSSSALIFYWGINRTFAQTDLHNILFSADYKKEFECIFDKKTITDDPTVYINITSKYVKTDAPEGCENWFVMINVPHLAGQDWDSLKADARKAILAKLTRILNTDIAPHIVCEQVLDPLTIQSRTGSYLGALYGNSSNNRMSAFLRHPNFFNSIKGLYICGGSVHPGGGIPLALSSAKIIDKLIP